MPEIVPVEGLSSFWQASRLAAAIFRSEGEGGVRCADSRGRGFCCGSVERSGPSIQTAVAVGKKRRSAEQGIQELCDQVGAQEEELRRGGQRRNVSDVRARISSRLRHEGGLFLTEIARPVGVCASAVANAIRRLETENKK